MDTRILPPDLFDTTGPEKKKDKPVVKSPEQKVQLKEKADKLVSKTVGEYSDTPLQPKKSNKQKTGRAEKEKRKKREISPDVAPESGEIESVEKIESAPPAGKEASPRKKAKKKKEGIHREKERVSDFPWENELRGEPRVSCPGCGEPVHRDSTVCIHCGAQFMACPHCNGHSAALHNPKMATEQRLNKILRQYTLFSLALPALPLQPILDCSACGHRVIFCEQCHKPMKTSAEKCPSCDFRVRRTKLIVNPFSIFESLFRRPNMGKALQQAVSDLLRSLSEW